MDEFLDMLGQRIDLSEHRGYKGGLDTVHGQTGQHSVYQVLGGAYISLFSSDITLSTAPGVPQARGDVPRVHAAALQRVRQAAAPAQEAHRQRHRGGGLPGGQHALQVIYNITYSIS